MANSAGNAEKEMSIIMDSLEYKINRLKETGVGIWQGFLDRGDVGQVVDGLTTILEAVQKVTDALGLLGTAGVAIGGFALFKNFGRSNDFALYGCEAIAA